MTAAQIFGKCRLHKTSLWLVGLLLLGACSTLRPGESPGDWMKFAYVIDGQVEVRFKVPPAEHDAGLEDIQFVSTRDDPIVYLVRAGYDPGRGRNRGLLLTNIDVGVRRVHEKVGGEISLDDIWNELYATYPTAATRFANEGIRAFAGREWLRVRLVEEESHAIDPVDATSPDSSKAFTWGPPGIVYSTPVNGELVLELSMYLFEKSADSRLFKSREKTLEEIAKTVTISAVAIQ